LDRQKSRQFARHLSDADHDQRMRKDARGMLARGPSCVTPRRRSLNANGLRGQNSVDSRKSVRPFKKIICHDIADH
jgi:hypothetical protein